MIFPFGCKLECKVMKPIFPVLYKCVKSVLSSHLYDHLNRPHFVIDLVNSRVYGFTNPKSLKLDRAQSKENKNKCLPRRNHQLFFLINMCNIEPNSKNRRIIFQLKC